MHGNLGFIVNNHLRAEPKDNSGFLNHKFQTNMHYYYILQPDWCLLLLVNMQDSLHCKQGSL